MSYILLADDDDIVRQIVADALSEAGHIVGQVADGDVALATMRQRPPKLAILDQMMPEMNGRTVLREMRSDNDLVMIPVMMLTAVSGREDQRITFYDGADHYMTKPFDPFEVVFWAEELMAMRIKRTLAVPN